MNNQESQRQTRDAQPGSLHEVLGCVPHRANRRLEILKLLNSLNRPVQPKDVGAEASDQTSADLKRLERFGLVKTSAAEGHPYFKKYEITDAGRKAIAA